MRPQNLLPIAIFGRLAASSPVTLSARAATAASLIAAIMPSSKSCDGADFPDECRTADQAAPFLIDAMQKYELYTYGEMAGVLSLIGVESVDMKFKHNVSPGRPGQVSSPY